MITKILKSNKMNTNNISKLFIILFALLIVFLSISISSAEEDYEITEVDEVKVLYVATPGFYAFNFMDLVGSHYRGARFDVDFVAGYKPDGFWGTPHDDFYALAENNYEGYDIVFLDMVNMYRDAFQTGADNAAANGTILISIMTGPSTTPPHTCYMPMSFTIRDHPELSTGPYSDDKEFIDKFFSIYSYAKSGQLNVDYQYDDNSIIEMRNLLMDEIIERKSPYEFCEVNYKDLSEFGDVYIMKNFEPHENIKHVHKGAKLEFKAVPFKGYEIDYWIGAVENPNDKSIATLTVNENTDVKVVFKKSESSICKLYINYGTQK
ncbi:MAG: hypothetical protein GX362_00435 [Methanosarcinaceae archaeon]|nr:hypothetical protein [Methanosarcinaceae archaeon]